MPVLPIQKTAGRPIDQQKTQHIFNAIDEILANEGIAVLSIERIAKYAGISKATLYRRFTNLRGVLTAYVETFTDNALDQSANGKHAPAKTLCQLEEILIKTGVELMLLISQPRVIAFDNAILAAGPQFMDLKRDLYKNGPQRAINSINELLMQANMSSPLLARDSLGDVLFHLWRSQCYDIARVEGKMQMSLKQLETHVTVTTQFFLTNLIQESFS